MPSLQIRDLPMHIYEMLADLAKRNRRSLAQQATVVLERVARDLGQSQRHDTVAALRESLRASGPRETSLDPVAAVREERDR